jgi:hypothetical protein
MPLRAARWMGNKELPPRWAFIVAFVLALVIQFVLAYGNDVASCQRTQHTRSASTSRNDTAVAFQRALADKVTDRSRQELRAATLLLGDTSYTARVVREFLALRAADDRRDARDYRNYANALDQTVAPSIDCSKVPPPT